MFRSVAFCVLLALPTAAQETGAKPTAPTTAKTGAAAAPLADVYAGEAAVIEHFDTTVRMKADGTGEMVRHVTARVHSEGAAQQSSVLTIFYNAANSDGTIEHVVVRKPDGTVVATPSTDSMELAAPVTREAPVYSDLKERQLPVRSLAAGDELEYDMRTVFRVAEAPDQFWGAEHFVKNGVVLVETLTLEVPVSKYVQVWCPRHPAKLTEAGGMRIYRWGSDQLKATSATLPDGKPDPVKDLDKDDEGRLLPSVAWTTFHNWAEVGDWYRGLAEKRAEPDETIRAKANALTAGLATPEEQIRALYTFVSEGTRYVGIDLGVGRYQPHAAVETLNNRYGDCKDKDTLLEALLRAKGFTTAPALVGVGITPVPDLPSPSLFNHVITTVLPQGKDAGGDRIWMDATPGAEPFRVLAPQIRGEQALLVPTAGQPGLVRIPVAPPFAYNESFTADASLDKDGLLTGHMVFSARSDAEVALRMLQRSAAPAQWDSVVQYLSGAMGFSGTVSHASLRTSAADGPATVSWDYKRPEFADWANRRILPLFPVLEVAVVDKEKEPEQDIDQGAPRTMEATTHMTLPAEYRADLPDAVHVVRPYATYDQRYSLSGGVLTVTRNINILREKVPRAEWKDYLAYTKAIGMGSGENYIQLIAPESKAVPTATSKPSGAAAEPGKQTAQAETGSGGAAQPDSPKELMTLADQQFRRNDIAGEKATLLALQQKAPDTPYLLSMLGYVALRENQPDTAIDDLKKELAKHPDDNVSIPVLLANVYVWQKRFAEAVALLESYEPRNDVSVSLTLANAQRLNGDAAGAVATLQRASANHAENRPMMNAYANALHRVHRDVEAAAVAKAAMDESDDPGVLNDNSYLLAEMGTDFDVAEKNARKSIDMREADTARIAVTEANTAAFVASANLIAAYDTLAYVLLKEGKAAEAEPYQQAAWFGRQDITLGDHLALIQEARGHRDEALATDELALATSNAVNNKDDYGEVQASVDRLRKAGAQHKGGSATQSLQTLRTFQVHRLPDAKGWGTFRIQVGAGGVMESEMVNGSAAVKPMSAELKQLKMQGGVPPGSKAKLLRDGVLSCSAGQATCEFVLMPASGLGAEGVRDDVQR